MATCRGSTSRNSIFDSFLQTWKEWQLTILMVVTMTLQLVLVVTGSFRKHTSNPLLHWTVWIAFIALDALAAYAIGLMLGEGCDTVFVLWAPILLFHLGASDSVSAYSPADNELWHRHGFKMSLEVLGAIYILSRAGDSCKFLGSSILLLLVGGFKYIERVLALRSGSVDQVVMSTRPIYKFMAMDHHHHFHRQEVLQSGSASAHYAEAAMLIVSGELNWYRGHQKDGVDDPFRDVVTYSDVVKCRDLKKAARYINEVCLAHALFKIYRRRLTNLRIHHKDDDYEKVRKIFFPSGQLSPLRIISVIDMELSFIYDGVFTKSSTGRYYHGFGLAIRCLSILLLFISAMDLLGLDVSRIECEGAGSVHLAGQVTILLVTLALMVECWQMFKIVRSNWTRVWLACTYIRLQRKVATSLDDHYKNSWYRWSARMVYGGFRYVGNPSKRHWEERIGQRSIVLDSMISVCWHYGRRLEVETVMRVIEAQAVVRNIVDVDASNVHYYLIERMARMFADVTSQNLAQRRDGIARSVRFPLMGSGDQPHNIELSPQFSPAHDSGLEQAILMWHVATSVCEMDLILNSSSPNAGEDSESRRRREEAKTITIALSRYCLHLLISWPKLTPGDPDLCHPLYAQLRSQLTKIFVRHPLNMESALLKDYHLAEVPGAATQRDMEAGAGASTQLNQATATLEAGIRLGRSILRHWATEEERWGKLAEVWVDILLYMAIAENAHPHTEQLAKGGELLTHIWVLLGHLGIGQRSWICHPPSS
ncbi:hypothetical protein KP509_37G006000 [Ceratopteris richardii]|uniref:DUF4220 domain-containing protein n=1 Tax=Ceratopteris richardii TaxID=49495 RepID=A0A8T2Q5Y2_CERRI|nr:hypothetical protein KP509_37G006000 [Ceratopteris richardii]